MKARGGKGDGEGRILVALPCPSSRVPREAKGEPLEK